METTSLADVGAERSKKEDKFRLAERPAVARVGKECGTVRRKGR